MPNPALRPCLGRCGETVVKGRCPACAKIYARTAPNRGATGRGYTRAWERFRREFVTRLVDLGIEPICGAVLPGGPTTSHSLCKSQGLVTWTSHDGTALHTDHQPPLRHDERRVVTAVCDFARVQLLCSACHARKTVAEGRPWWS